jgi:hypothetical protein
MAGQVHGNGVGIWNGNKNKSTEFHPNVLWNNDADFVKVPKKAGGQ